jgi:hypothetical protein
MGCMIPFTKLFDNAASLNNIVTKLYIILTHDLAIFTANFFILANIFLGVGMPLGTAGIFPGWRVGYECVESPALSQTVGSLLRTPCLPENLLNRIVMICDLATFSTTKTIFANFTILAITTN